MSEGRFKVYAGPKLNITPPATFKFKRTLRYGRRMLVNYRFQTTNDALRLPPIAQSSHLGLEEDQNRDLSWTKNVALPTQKAN
uniref:Major sperm protein n=1 Tax=Rhabditophanes sp. KR3021 TaxID=114890 RepID=A0AC35U9V0_9BILA